MPKMSELKEIPGKTKIIDINPYTLWVDSLDTLNSQEICTFYNQSSFLMKE